MNFLTKDFNNIYKNRALIIFFSKIQRAMPKNRPAPTTHVTSDNTCSNATSFIIATLSSSSHLLSYFLLFSSSSSPFLFRKSPFLCFILLLNFLLSFLSFSVTVERVRQWEMIERQGATSVKMRYRWENEEDFWWSSKKDADQVQKGKIRRQNSYRPENEFRPKLAWIDRNARNGPKWGGI